MVLRYFFGSKDEDKFDSFDDPRKFEQADCLSCRVLGSTTLVSLGGYTYFSGMQQLKAQRKVIEMSKSKYKYGSRQLGIVLLSGTIASLGVYRMFN